MIAVVSMRQRAYHAAAWAVVQALLFFFALALHHVTPRWPNHALLRTGAVSLGHRCHREVVCSHAIRITHNSSLRSQSLVDVFSLASTAAMFGKVLIIFGLPLGDRLKPLLLSRISARDRQRVS